MKRTIKEVYDLIKEKMNNANINFESDSVSPFKSEELKGTIMAYKDVLCLIESSHLLEEDKETQKKLKALEIIKEHIDYIKNNDCFVFVNMTNEVTDLLKEVLS